mmetsp:Transcript_33308/g.38237  ORF Transcript_33308/g.38237 Transcript_33308/m.38237 type:complete len:96 (+) Transcript_33308:109-396(+)
MHYLFESAFHKQEKSDKLLKYVGSIIIPRVHVRKIYLDKKMEQVLFKYCEERRKYELYEQVMDEQESIYKRFEDHTEGNEEDVENNQLNEPDEDY